MELDADATAIMLRQRWQCSMQRILATSMSHHKTCPDRRLPTKFTAESLIQVLDEFLPPGALISTDLFSFLSPFQTQYFTLQPLQHPGCYNFVYVPHDKRKLRNLALAFVNFTNSESAKCPDGKVLQLLIFYDLSYSCTKSSKRSCWLCLASWC